MQCIRYAVILLQLAGSASVAAQETDWFLRKTEWRGFEQYHFKVAERNAYLVAPQKALPDKPWVWRARFPGYHADMDVRLLVQGYHVGYVDVAGLFGSPRAMAIGDAFYDFVTGRRGLSARPALEGVSRGGLFVYNWAARHPQRVACIYCDTPVCDIRSWPGGFGRGIGSQPTWRQCMQAYGLNDEQAKAWKQNPIDHAATLAGAAIPMLHVVSENDRVVPPAENTDVLKNRLQQRGHSLEVISVSEGTAKSDGHHFEHPAVEKVVAFIRTHADKSPDRMKLLKSARRVVFLGDSITYDGRFVASFHAWLEEQSTPAPIVINVGLPSETVSGLSEQGHAGGRFPRPDLNERLDRVLTVTEPDLVFACYGMNCAIYQSFDTGRFAAWKRGMERLKSKAEATGARIVFVTPPCFDDARAKKSFSYNGVLDEYAQWLIGRRRDGWTVIDLHNPMTRELVRRRTSDAVFTFQPDAVHPNAAGHRFIARQLIAWFRPAGRIPESGPALKRSARMVNLRRDAYLSAAGHKRPGIKPGLSVEEAEKRVRALENGRAGPGREGRAL